MERGAHVEHVQDDALRGREHLRRKDREPGDAERPRERGQQPRPVAARDGHTVHAFGPSRADVDADLTGGRTGNEQGEVRRRVGGLDPVQVRGRHRGDEGLDVRGRPIGERGSNGRLGSRQAVGLALGSQAPFDRPLHAKHQIPDQAEPPGRRRARPRRGGVGQRHDREQREAPGVPHRGGDAQHDVLVVHVPPGRRVGQQEMLANHEQDVLAEAHGRREAVEQLARQFLTGDEVRPAADLPDVVQQRPEQHRRGIVLQPRDGGALELVGRRRQDASGLGGRLQQVHVHRIPVIRIALRPGTDEVPLGQHARERAPFVGDPKGPDTGLAGGKGSQQRVERPRRVAGVRQGLRERVAAAGPARRPVSASSARSNADSTSASTARPASRTLRSNASLGSHSSSPGMPSASATAS